MLEKLGPKQQFAVDGPNGPPMYRFVCTICDKKFCDTKLYFTGVAAIKCMWCNKYSKKKVVNKIVT